MTLGEFFQRYQSNRPPGKETNTSYTESIHIKHLLRLLAENTPLSEIPIRAQSYATARYAEKTRTGNPISHVTIKKELGTLSSIWNQWGINEGIVTAPLSFKRVQLPKRKQQPRFQTWDEVMRKSKGDLTSELWESVFLSVSETQALLADVRDGKSIIRGQARYFPFTFPMFAFVAYTGCRRSEMLRARVEDIDFSRNELTIREKKRDRTKEETYRHVPLAPALKAILQDWLKTHPGGEILFCRTAGESITAQMASHHFRWAVEATKWKPLPGFHVLRHSFVSNLASRGVSDHVIMGLVGHLNRETTRRYLHLRPQTLEAALGLLYGEGTPAEKLLEPT
jgi:integrase